MPSTLEDKRIINILMLSLGFMLVFVSFQTMSNILIALVESIISEGGDVGDPFYALAIVYGVLALFNFVVPPIISVLGTRISMVLGSICYALYIISFFAVSNWVLYAASVVLGVGAATIWTAQGTYLTLNSDAYTIARNSAIFWATFQLSTLFGNTFVYFAFSDPSTATIEHATRELVYGVLAGICLIGVFVLMLLRPPLNIHGHQIPDSTNAPPRAFTRAFNLIGTRDMLLLCFSFWFTGVNLTFASSVYSSWIGHTTEINQTNRPKMLIGLVGIFFGVGEVLGGSLFGVLADITTFQWGRNPIVILGSVVLLVAYVLIYLNLPPCAANYGSTCAQSNNSTSSSTAYLDPTTEASSSTSFFAPPRQWIAILCSFFLGFGDSCFNTQIYSIVATIYRDDPAPPFAMFKFIQSVASGVAFLFFKFIPLRLLLLALAVMDVLAAITFFPVEVEARTPEFEPDELDIQIPAGPSVDRTMVSVAKDK